jgi:hypothetical protein
MIAASVPNVVGNGLYDAVKMVYEVWWALVLGFLVSAVVQAWVPRARIQRALAGEGPAAMARATVLGAASSSCSYAAIAIAKSMFQKGASAATSLAFQFASTNIVWELGLVMWVLIGWQFALADFVGGVILIVLMWALLRLFVSRAAEAEARRHAEHAATGHQHHSAESDTPLRKRLVSADAWSDVAHNFRGDWQMLWKEISIGFVLAGFAVQIPNRWYGHLFLHSGSRTLDALENALVGPVIAMLTFVCSVGNVPLAAVLWSGGISFGGVLAFIFADLIVLPIVAIYRRYYGTAYALRIVALMFVTMVAAALVVDGLFSATGLVPDSRPSRGAVVGSIGLDYKLVLNALAVAIFAALVALTLRRGAIDPICGMTVDRKKALSLTRDGATTYFCGAHCLHTFEAGHAHAHSHARTS